MRFTSITREAYRDTRSGTARAGTFGLVLALLLLALAAADLLAVRVITDAAERFRTSGASIVTLTAPDRIDGAACDALADIRGIRAPGAHRPPPPPPRAGRAGAAPPPLDQGVVANALPSSTLPVFDVTPGLRDVLHASGQPSAGLILSDQAAASLAVREGDALATRQGPVPVAGAFAYPSDGRRPGFGYAALAPIPAGTTFDECWVDVWPTLPEIPALLRTTLLPEVADTQPPVIAQLNATLGASFDGAARMSERVTQFAPPVAAFVAAGLGFLAVRTRRMHLASALHAGVTRPALAAVVALELLTWVIPAALAATAAIVLIVATAPAEAGSFAQLGLRVIVAGVAATPLGALLAFATIRERHLFRYFRTR